MHVFEMVAIVVTVGVLGGIAREWLKRQDTPQVDLSGIESRLDQVESLKQRVETLEAIVTDKGYDLSQKINNLK